MTRRVPSEMEPTTLAKPMILTSTAEPGTYSASNCRRTFSSSALETAMKSSFFPVVGSISRSSALMMAPEKSFATSRPTIPAFRTLRRTWARPSASGWKSSGMTLPAAMPSSTTSV